MPRSRTYSELLRAGAAELRSAGIELPRFEAELLLAEAAGRRREWLIGHGDVSATSRVAAAYNRMIARRAGHEPLAYITGHREFMSLDFEVTADVLVPRPDSEMLVEQALVFLAPLLDRRERHDSPLIVIDVGTGTGALALSIAYYQPAARVWAVDISSAAAAVAQRNAMRLGLTSRVKVVTGDLLGATGLPGAGEVDLILANLPYVPAASLAALAPEVSVFEPRLALDGGEDGLELISRLLPQAAAALAGHGALGLECDAAQCTLVAERLRQAGFARTESLPDLAGVPRTVWGYKDGQTARG